MTKEVLEWYETKNKKTETEKAQHMRKDKKHEHKP